MNTVTVIVPAYNARRTIGDTLASLAGQSRRDFATVVVDDGSTDDTAGLVASEFPWATVIRQPNAGPAAARNRGAAEATTPWLAFLDADDIWLPWRLEVQLAAASRHPEILLWCGQIVELAAAASVIPPADTVPPVAWLDLDDLAICNPVPTTTVLLQREAFQAAGGFDPQFRGPEDYDLWLRIAARGRIGKLEVPLAGYRHGVDALSHDDRRFLPQVLRVIDKAYSPGGVLAGCPTRRRAVATQYASAAYTASLHGATARALGHLARSWLICPQPLGHGRQGVGGRWRLLLGILLKLGQRPGLESR